jgi:hypothetical protein
MVGAHRLSWLLVRCDEYSGSPTIEQLPAGPGTLATDTTKPGQRISEGRVVMVVTRLAGQGATGDVWKGVVELADKDGKNTQAAVAIKLGTQDTILHEAAVYEYLKAQNVSGIPAYGGLFVYEDEDDTVNMLVMSDCGDPADWWQDLSLAME